jgi:hypothetical protein
MCNVYTKGPKAMRDWDVNRLFNNAALWRSRRGVASGATWRPAVAIAKASKGG